MKRILTHGLLALLFVNLVLAQKRSTMLGDFWTGEVVNTNDSSREITIKFQDKEKSETFTGILEAGYKVKMKDGSSQELSVSEITPGTRVRLFSKSKNQEISGRKVKINSIYRIDFLGKDEFSRLREALSLDASAIVSVNESGKLAAAKPLKVYLAIEDEHIRKRFVGWADQWNRKQAAKSGPIEFVSSFSTADAGLVVLKGAEKLLMTPYVIGAQGEVHKFPAITVFLVVHNGDGLEVLWKEVLLTNPDSQAEKGRIEKEIEKRLKAR